MLLKFHFENFLSFKNTGTIDFEAASIREIPENTIGINNSSIDIKVLKSIAIYGANASGKSNVLKAFMFVRNLVLFSSSDSKAEHILSLQPYKLDVKTEHKPSLFESIILIDDIQYRYGILLTNDTIISEWLYATEKKKEFLLFKRSEQEFEITKKFSTESGGNISMIATITRSNALFISTLGQFQSPVTQKIIDWFKKSIVILNSNNQGLLNYTASLLENPYFSKRINSIINKSDLSFSSVKPEIKEKANRSGLDEWVVSALYQNENNYKIKTLHKKDTLTQEQETIYFDLREDESLGTQKYVMLLGPLLKALKENSVIWIDELDARIHTNLLLFVLKFFNSRINNPGGAQLIYTSHNNTILKKDLRRDQMFFVKREQHTGSAMIALNQWDSKIRSDASFDKDYLEGKYGAVPKIDLSPDLFD